ncbi:PLP-dependent aminotransferase family protein [Paenibacillus oenotherae]|uniref:PLP-dependent aminotransferase family protein n=1 Tax=Paenibacillus oenotherae TaxID=1435645 RepID=A0ABS7D351_9BACL|nr:PLP-dependent aminotransferase family protein [Paenibacillus oenotherae]MBW7474355.1 PLP-dependent aminotransferase family protein [Paenibacillus oenotherae]
MIAITPWLDKESSTPIYMQLYSFMKQEIESGAIKEGSRLPSIRQLSAHLKLSKNTIETAYQQLVAEGYAESRLRSGLRVLALEQPPSGTVLPPASAAGIRSQSQKEASVRSRYDFRYGDVEQEAFPYALWRKCLLGALQCDPKEVFGYGHPQGSPALRSEIAQYLYQSRGVSCSPDQIFLSSGTQQAVSLLCQLLPLTGETIAMENPGYEGVRTVFNNHGCTVAPIGLDHDGLSLTQLSRQKAKAVYVTPSHQFPLGMVLPIQKRNKLLQWAGEHDSFIIEDDYDSEFRYQGQPIPALKALDNDERVIYLGSFSKSFIPAVRLTYTVMPLPLTQAFQQRMGSYSQSVSPLLGAAMLLFMREGHFERHIRRMRRLYQTKHKAMIAAIMNHMGNHVEIIGQKAGLHLILVVHNRERDELLQLAGQAGVHVYSPQHHWTDPGDCPSSYIMLGFGGMNGDIIEEGIRRLGQAWFGSGSHYEDNR